MVSQKQKNLLFLGLLCTGIAAITLWMFVLNKGTIEVQAEPPYRVILAKGPEILCEIDPCVIKIFPHDYTLTFEKSGYYRETKQLSISRWQKTFLKITPTFIPMLKKRSAAEITSENGDTWMTRKGEPRLPENSAAAQGKAKNIFFYLEQKKSDAAQSLIKMDREKKIVETLAIFPNTISSAKLFLSNDENVVVVVDATEEIRKMYVVDIEKKTRKRILDQKGVDSVKISPSSRFIIFMAEMEGKYAVYIFDMENENKETLALTPSELEKFIWMPSDTFVGATARNIKKKTDSTYFSVERVKVEFEEKIELKSLKNDSSKNISEIFIEYFPLEKIYRIVYEPKAEESMKIKNIRLSDDEKNIYFESFDEFYELQLQP
ncbi:hypothetical protein HYV57_01090 [Candidatus Peregrinibacteria bacterium]|nr:hypothetical protein [Candidatus Peregrinibacteria bacterium]